MLLAFSAALVMSACGADTAPPDARPGDPTLAAIRSDIFNGTCALGSCHAAPTVAAKLDLHSDGLCQRLVRQTSCLFPDKVLVLPGKPEASFLMDKLRGTGLEGTPDPACATSNVLMPLGLPALSGGQLAQIEEWIRAGANCGGDILPDAGIIDAGGAGDAGIDGPDESLADIASISAVATMIKVGERTQGTVTFTHGVPPSGQVIFFEVDEVNQNVVSVDAFKSLEPGVSSVTFDVLGQMLGSAIITASSGTNSMSITITVTGVTLSDDKDSTTQIAGTLPIPDRRIAGSSDKKTPVMVVQLMEPTSTFRLPCRKFDHQDEFLLPILCFADRTTSPACAACGLCRTIPRLRLASEWAQRRQNRPYDVGVSGYSHVG